MDSATSGAGSNGLSKPSGGGSAGEDGASKGDAGGGGAGSDAGTSSLPPEKEKNLDFGAPEGSPNFVYIPATGADTIVKVSGATLKVTLIEVGSTPIALKVIPGQDAAVVLNAGSSDVTIVRSTDTSDALAFVDVLPLCNAIEIAPDGKHAIVFYDHARAQQGDPVGSFQTISVLTLDEGSEKAVSVSTGFRPRAVGFTQDGNKALIITDDGVGVLEFSKLQSGGIVPPVPVSTNPLDKPAERQVLTTPDGLHAVVRASEKSGLSIVDLVTKKIVDVSLTSVPTDLDLLPDGSAALAVLRESKEVAFVQLPTEATDSYEAKIVSVGDLTAGLAKISDDGLTAVLYTSVSGIEQVATLDLTTLAVTPVLLRKTVDSVVIPAGMRKAILVHKPAAGPNPTKDPVETLIDNSEGYTLFDLDTGFTALVVTPSRLTEIAAADGPLKAWILLPDPKGLAHKLEEADLVSFMTKDYDLGSKPEHGRYLKKANMLAVTQDHPSGRITFIPGLGGEPKTVTGYELNGQGR